MGLMRIPCKYAQTTEYPGKPGMLRLWNHVYPNCNANIELTFQGKQVTIRSYSRFSAKPSEHLTDSRELKVVSS